jgi:error-prone DNA polymerase
MERVLTGKPRRAGWPIDEPNGDGGDSPAWSRKRGEYQPLDVQRPFSSVPYAELHAHSAYSFLDGASTPEELVEEAARLDLRAIALTDHDGLYGVVRFAEAAKELEMQTVFGAELSLGGGDRTEDPDPPDRTCWCWPAGRRAIDGCRDSWRPRIWQAARKASCAMTMTR